MRDIVASVFFQVLTQLVQRFVICECSGISSTFGLLFQLQLLVKILFHLIIFLVSSGKVGAPTTDTP